MTEWPRGWHQGIACLSLQVRRFKCLTEKFGKVTNTAKVSAMTPARSLTPQSLRQVMPTKARDGTDDVKTIRVGHISMEGYYGQPEERNKEMNIAQKVETIAIRKVLTIHQ